MRSAVSESDDSTDEVDEKPPPLKYDNWEVRSDSSDYSITSSRPYILNLL